MTKFAQPVSMPCTEEQYNRDLKEGLRGLGYKMNIVFANNMFYIGTNFDYQNNEGGSMPYSSIHERNRHYIPEYNPELFLAIAGMREGEDVHVGEWVVSVEKTFTNGINYEKDELVKVTEVGTRIPEVDHKGHFGFYLNETYFRKATLSELTNHFKKEKMFTLEDLKNGKVVMERSKNIDELNDVLGYLNPNDTRKARGEFPYYFFSHGNWGGASANLNNKPTQSVKLFHHQLPKKEHSFKFGDKVKAWDFEGSTKYDFIFVSKIECEFPYLLADSESWLESLHMGKGCHLVQRKHCIPFPEPLKITRSEIAEWKGTDNFEIV